MYSSSKRQAAAATGLLPDVPRARAWLLAVATFFVIALVAVWQVPQYLDWVRYRSSIEALASAKLGQPVAIHGAISLNLLPQPVLTAAQVDVGGGGSAQPSIHVEALRLRVALWPLITGRVDARELVLQGANIRVPWNADAGLQPARTPPWLTAFRARIEDGRLTIGQLEFTGIEATLASQETGAMAASGSAKFSGQDWHFTARLTAAGADGAAGLNVSLDGQGKAAGLGAGFAGQLAPDGTLTGTISSRGPNLALLLPSPRAAFRAEGRLTIGGGLVALDDLALQIGNSPASAAIALRVTPNQQLDIAISAGRLDLDAWLPVLLHDGPTIAGVSLPIGMDFSVESAALGGGALQHVRAAFDLSQGYLTVRDFSAALPGNGHLELSGRVARSDPSHPRFEGDAELDAPVLRATLQWLHDAAPGLLPADYLSRLPDGVLQRAALSAHVVAGSDELSLQRLAGTVDGSALVGTTTFRRGAPLAIAADIALDRLALDPWRPRRQLDPGNLAKSLTGLDIGLRLAIGTTEFGNVSARNVDVEAIVAAGSASLRRLTAVVDGVRLTASGNLAADGRISEGQLKLVADDATPLSAMLPTAWRGTPALWHGPIALTAQADGVPGKLGLGIKLRIADATLDAQPTVDLTSGRWSGEMTLRHPGARRLLATLGLPEHIGLPDLPAWIGDGSLSLVAKLSGATNRLTANSFDLTAAALHLAGELAIDTASEEPRVTGQVTADMLPLPLPNGASGVPLPIGMLRGWQAEVGVTLRKMMAGSAIILRDTSAMVTVSDGALRIGQLDGQLAGGTLAANFLFNGVAHPPTLALQAQISKARLATPLADTPIDLGAGTVAAEIDVSAIGYSPATILATLTGRLSATVTDGALTGFDLFAVRQAVERTDAASVEQAAKDALMSGTTSFDQLDIVCGLAQGDIVLTKARMRSSAGDGMISGDLNLPTRSLDLLLTLRPALANAPGISVRLAGPLDQLKQTPELASLARYVAERVH